MTKKEFTKVLSDKVVDKEDMAVIVDSFLDTIKEVLASGDKISFNGFGTFEVADRAARKARNPQTGEEIDVPASKAPKFKAAKALKDAVKNA